jgi:hypothetical protein
MGHEQTSRHVRVMSALPPKADIRQRIEHVCYVPKADINALASNSSSAASIEKELGVPHSLISDADAEKSGHP